MAPAHPPLSACVVKHDALQGYGENSIDVIIHHTIQSMNIYSYLLVYDNCYRISCHSLECVKLLHYHTEGVLKIRCTKYPTHHLRWSLHVQHSTCQHQR